MTTRAPWSTASWQYSALTHSLLTVESSSLAVSLSFRQSKLWKSSLLFLLCKTASHLTYWIWVIWISYNEKNWPGREWWKYLIMEKKLGREAGERNLSQWNFFAVLVHRGWNLHPCSGSGCVTENLTLEKYNTMLLIVIAQSVNYLKRSYEVYSIKVVYFHLDTA